ncbi:MAG: HAMP domain-containing sensor histidine kinase [Myxococcota bacterium]
MLRWIDRWVDVARLEGDDLRMARAIVGMAISIAPWAPIIGGSVMLLGERVAGGAIVLTGVICLALPPLVYRTGRIGLAAHLLVFGLVQGLVVSGTLLGGAGSPPTSWLALAPVVATATGGVRAGSIWTGLVIASALFIHAVQWAGYVENPYLYGGWEYVGTISCVGLYFLVGVFLRANDMLYRHLLARTRDAEERERLANQAKSGFLASMSHEIRTPLNAILGYTELVLEDAEERGETGMVEDLGRVGRSGRHLLELVNDILDLSKIEAGRMEVAVEPVALEPLLRAVAEEVQPLVDARENRMELDLVPVTVTADPARLRQCVLNLLSNAAKFTEGGDILVRLSRDGSHARLEVRDTGIGMDADELRHVFEPFAQGTADTARKYGGTGLGMSIAQKLVELMGGALTVESRKGHGSTFSIRLPTVG